MTMGSIQALFKCITDINNSDKINKYSNKNEKAFLSTIDIHDEDLFNQLMELDNLLNGVIITKTGGTNYCNIRRIEELGNSTGMVVRIYAGEKDSSGWLTGVIEAPRFKYVFG